MLAARSPGAVPPSGVPEVNCGKLGKPTRWSGPNSAFQKGKARRPAPASAGEPAGDAVSGDCKPHEGDGIVSPAGAVRLGTCSKKLLGVVKPKAAGEGKSGVGREKIGEGAVTPIAPSNDGIGPKREFFRLASESCSSSSRRRPLLVASPGVTAWSLAAASAAASSCQASSKAPRISCTMGCAETVEFRNSSRSQLRQKGLRKSASLGVPLRSISTLSALKSPCLRPCRNWKRRPKRAACCTTRDLRGCTCSQVPLLRNAEHAAVL
mmetsp:Transcript_93185/g.199918  ORF Transcript_93185/g.199918 Transcript_93185/m.199918 type:complete len:266 (+) Transcript_93185:700-1497(+)